MRYIVEHGQTTGSRQKIVCCGYSAARRCTRLISVPMAKVEPAGAASMAFTMKSVEPAASAASTTAIGHSGCTIDLHAGVLGAGLLDLVDREALVHRAEAVPEDDARVARARRRCCRRAPCAGSTSASARAARPSPSPVLRPRCWSGKKSTRCPRSNAHSSTVLAFDEVQTMPPLRADEALERGRRVHVGDGDDRHPAVGVGRCRSP